MKTYSLRFENAVAKLYTAFHNDTLNPECCKQCAVGNILDQKDYWKHFSEYHGSLNLSYVGKVNEAFGKRFNGYSPSELVSIELAFLEGCGYSLPMKAGSRKPSDPLNKDLQFLGLSNVIERLCEIEGVTNLMDCRAVFAYEPATMSYA